MKYIKTEISDGIGRIILSGGKGNELNMDFLEEIIAIHTEFQKNPQVKLAILESDVEGYFSNGIEDTMILGMDHESRRRVFHTLLETIKAIYGFEKPEIALINGHAMAGGAVLGILPDFRIMAEGKYRYSFSEIHVGLIIPGPLMEIIRRTVGDAPMREVTMLGRAYKPQEALRIGLVDEVVSSDELRKEGGKLARKLLRLPQDSLRSMKKNLRSDVVRQFSDDTILMNSGLYDLLAGPDFEEGMRAIIEDRRPRFDRSESVN